MKLTNKQLQILVDNIYTKHFEKAYEEERNDFEKARKEIRLTREEEKVVKNYVTAANHYAALTTYRYTPKTTEAYATQNLIHYKQAVLKFTSKVPTRNQIEEAIVLATIDSKDMNDLIKAVTSKFKLK